MTKKISGAEFPLAKIFSSDFDYVIPSYQRPYAWTTVQAGELFSDLHDFYCKEDILRLDSFLADGAATYDPSILTIEHVLPQTVAKDSVWAAQWPNVADQLRWLHRLANLVPLNQRRNSQAQNHDFERKKKAYFGGKQGVSSYVLTTQVLNTPSWTPTVVEKRQSDLIDVLSNAWSLK